MAPVTTPVGEFVARTPSDASFFRAVILFGRNVASYKFALGKTLVELALYEQEEVSLEDLAVPFSRHLTEHLRSVDTQGTSKSSRFLDTCRSFNAGEIDDGQLVEATARLGFVNVIDAFHVVGTDDVPIRFFVDERQKGGGIRLTGPLLDLVRSEQAPNLPLEIEARWRLVETSWDLNLPARSLQVTFEPETDLLVVKESATDRVNLTGVRDALNGYQKGRCFYCGDTISISGVTGAQVHVEHVVPRTLMERAKVPWNLDGVWNLVLACPNCNLSKSARVPGIECLAQVHRRNEYLIGSHHPLRETLIAQTGPDAASRRGFLLAAYNEAVPLGVWKSECGSREDL